MSKALFEEYRDREVMTRVDMPYVQFKMLEAEYEMTFIKHHVPALKDVYKQDKRYRENSQILSEVMREREEIESEIRTNTLTNG